MSRTRCNLLGYALPRSPGTRACAPGRARADRRARPPCESLGSPSAVPTPSSSSRCSSSCWAWSPPSACRPTSSPTSTSPSPASSGTSPPSLPTTWRSGCSSSPSGRTTAVNHIEHLKFHIERQNPPLMIPASALIIRTGGPRVALVSPDQKIELQAVEPGRDYGTSVEGRHRLDGPGQARAHADGRAT